MARSQGTRSSDDGSAMIIAVVVMMVLSTLTLALLARTLSTMSFVRSGQDYDAALAAADAGLAQAVYRIENGATASWEEGGVNGASTYRFYAQRSTSGTSPPTEFVVSAKGRVGKSRHGVQAKVTRSALFPFAMFGYQNLDLNGATGSQNFYVVGSVGAPVNVGSNGLVTCNGASAANLRFKSVAGFSGCPVSQWQNLEPKQARIDLEPPPSPNVSCPTGGLFTGFVDGHAGSPYVCRQDVTFSGAVNVINGPLKVYVLNSLKVDGTVDPDACHALDIGSAVINAAAPARQVQLYKADDCALSVGNGNTSDQLTFSGVLYAPDTQLVINGGKWFTGSIMVAQMKVNGSPNLVVGYDTDLSTYYGPKWRVSRYGEVPSSSFTFPSGTEP
jgi:hypothetical protein